MNFWEKHHEIIIVVFCILVCVFAATGCPGTGNTVPPDNQNPPREGD